MTHRHLDTEDMLGTPWSEMHCGVLAVNALQRCGVDVEDRDLWVGPDITRGAGRFDTFLDRHAAQWQSMGESGGAATRLGDVIVSMAPVGGPAPIHLSVLVNEGSRQAITTTELSGAILVSVYRIPRIVGVYRWKGAGVDG